MVYKIYVVADSQRSRLLFQ